MCGRAETMEAKLPTALYCRLSREDGDREESDSIGNQRSLLENFVSGHPELTVRACYIDDGYTGTHFRRPGFQRMIRDIEDGAIRCVVVKDLSRFGRDYIETGRDLERWLPEHGVRFIAVTDGIDSSRGAYDMMVPLKNLFNTQYARDISQKVRAALHAKQQQGQFIGAFAGYGYRKDPQDHNRLLVDPPAAEVVRRIFTLYESGVGKVGIAKELNAAHIPCPSEYKRLTGEKYRNGRRLPGTTYWTYATIHRILQNPLYIGSLAQGRAERVQMHGPARPRDRKDWAVAEHAHQPILDLAQWQRVQALLRCNARTPALTGSVSPFAGLLKCGDCGRAMVKTRRSGGIYYTCGSYRRYGAGTCSSHTVAQEEIIRVVLGDLNRLLGRTESLPEIVAAAAARQARDCASPVTKLQEALERVRHRRQSAYEDYQDTLLSREEYLRYRGDYDRQAQALQAQIEELRRQGEAEEPASVPWVRDLLETGRLQVLDRATVSALVGQIRIYEGGRMEIDYRLAASCREAIEP